MKKIGAHIVIATTYLRFFFFFFFSPHSCVIKADNAGNVKCNVYNTRGARGDPVWYDSTGVNFMHISRLLWVGLPPPRGLTTTPRALGFQCLSSDKQMCGGRTDSQAWYSVPFLMRSLKSGSSRLSCCVVGSFCVGLSWFYGARFIEMSSRDVLAFSDSSPPAPHTPRWFIDPPLMSDSVEK